MKRTPHLAKLSRAFRVLRFAAFGSALSLSGTLSGQEAETEAQQTLTVAIDDLQGRVDFESESTREHLLEDAFYRAAERHQWLGEYEIDYNRSTPKDAAGRLQLNVIDWERNRAGTYECTATATYYTLDGQKIDLGLVHGLRAGIDVSTGWDVNDRFREAAQDAFSQALKRLAERAPAQAT